MKISMQEVSTPRNMDISVNGPNIEINIKGSNMALSVRLGDAVDYGYLSDISWHVSNTQWEREAMVELWAAVIKVLNLHAANGGKRRYKYNKASD